MAVKMTKVEQRWRWLAERIWGPSLAGWSQLSDRVPKSDRALLDRKIKLGHAETDEYGMYRMTDKGRAALGDA